VNTLPTEIFLEGAGSELCTRERAGIEIVDLGIQPYEKTWAAMSAFTNQRAADTRDQLWLVQHPSVFTQGQAGKAEHLLAPGDIPVIKTDRGGQVTYHGPGQLVAYPLLDLRRLNMGVRDLVTALEQVIVATLAHYGVEAYAKANAPGVYVKATDVKTADIKDRKIASLGLRVRRGCSFHGLSLNLSMDLTPFSRINPCGCPGLVMTQLQDLVLNPPSFLAVQEQLVTQFTRKFAYQPCTIASNL
jgi:lipoyl(octanoyl) transferase